MEYDPNIQYLNGLLEVFKIKPLRVLSWNSTATEIKFSEFQSFIIRSHRTSDIEVVKDLFVKDEYLGFVEYINRSLKIERPLTLIDAGSNIGLFPIYLGKYFSLKKIVGIEPDKGNFKICFRNLKVQSGAVLLNNALWINSGNLKISTDFRGGQEWSLAVVQDKELSGKVQGVILKRLLDENFDSEIVDILKVDIEGSEKELLSDQDFLESLGRIRFICMEVHEELISMREAIDAIEKSGFQTVKDRNMIYGRNLSF